MNFAENRKTKFTFMEMIAIMVIMVVLTTLIMPVVIKSREWGKSIKCKSNMKTISDAIIGYTTDNSGNLPYTRSIWSQPSWTFYMCSLGYLPAPKKFIYTWYNAANYKNTGIYTGYPADYSSVWACPSQEIAPLNQNLAGIVFGDPNYNTNFLNTGFYWHGSHYAMNSEIPYSYVYKTGGHNIQVLSKKLRGASSIGLLIDAAGGINGDVCGFWATGGWNTPLGSGSSLGSNLVWVRHWGKAYGLDSSNYRSSSYSEIGGGQLNTVFLDGHTESWTNRVWWNKYYTPFSYNKNPFTFYLQ